jgi:hypothetical protein
MIDRDQPKIEPKEWRYDLLKEKDPNYLINEAPLDGLLAIFHNGSKAGTRAVGYPDRILENDAQWAIHRRFCKQHGTFDRIAKQSEQKHYNNWGRLNYRGRCICVCGCLDLFEIAGRAGRARNSLRPPCAAPCRNDVKGRIAMRPYICHRTPNLGPDGLPRARETAGFLLWHE